MATFQSHHFLCFLFVTLASLVIFITDASYSLPNYIIILNMPEGQGWHFKSSFDTFIHRDLNWAVSGSCIWLSRMQRPWRQGCWCFGGWGGRFLFTDVSTVPTTVPGTLGFNSYLLNEWIWWVTGLGLELAAIAPLVLTRGILCSRAPLIFFCRFWMQLLWGLWRKGTPVPQWHRKAQGAPVRDSSLRG